MVPHPRPTRRDAATRRGHRCPRVRPRRATWIPRGFHRRAPTRADSGQLGPESAGIGRYRPISAGIGRYRPISANIGRNRLVSAETAETADSGRNSKKKKKKPRTHRLLNSNPTSAQMHSKCQKHSSHYISLTLLSALVAL